MTGAEETCEVLAENGFEGRSAESPNPHALARIDLEAGPIVTLYKTGKALVQGKGPVEDVKAVLRACDWKVK